MSYSAGPIFDFNECLARSHAQQDAPWWEHVYRRAFPAFQSMTNVRQDGWAQRGGIDRVIVLSSGKTLSVDEKADSHDSQFFVLEFWSDLEKEVKGWVAKDLACDYIAYAFVPKATCYLLPALTLRAAWRRFGPDWVKQYRQISARNRGYTTRGVLVPINVLLDGMTGAMTVSWANADGEQA